MRRTESRGFYYPKPFLNVASRLLTIEEEVDVTEDVEVAEEADVVEDVEVAEKVSES